MELYGQAGDASRFSDLFLKTVGLSNEEFELFASHFKKQFLPRKYFFTRAGQVCTHIAYILKGSARTYTVDDKGGEHILFFAFEDWLIGDLESMCTNQPGKLNIQATEDCELFCISFSEMTRLEEKMPKLKDWHSTKKARSHFATINQLTEVKTQTPEERYLNLHQKHPHIFQRIPLQYIASYLGIEPPSLSRLRKRLSVK